MGFTTGFTGGVTLTLSIAYLTVLAHERNRTNQALALRSQSRVLTSLLEPTPLPPPQSRAELAREERSTIVEAAKDRWNDELERGVRWLQHADWNQVRENAEGTIARLLGGGLAKSRDGVEDFESLVEDQGKIKLHEAVEATKTAARTGAGEVSKAAGQIVPKTHEIVEATRNAAYNGAQELSRAAGEVKPRVQDAIETSRSAVKTGVEEVSRVAGQVREDVKTRSRPVINRAMLLPKDLTDYVETKFGDAAAAKLVVFDEIDRHMPEIMEMEKRGVSYEDLRAATREVVRKGIRKGSRILKEAAANVRVASGADPVEEIIRERLEGPSGPRKTAEDIIEERLEGSRLW